jgi:TRAP-type mannitol/chloroaromatic compound transport system permease small subunit
MERLVHLIESISTWSGKTFAWCILLLTGVTCYDVLMRYIFRMPWLWAYDVEYILYGVLFMMAGAYTLARDGHVRGDVLYGFFPPRVQASLDLVLYFLFFIPGVAALAYSGIDFAHMSWQLQERSSVTPGGPPLYHFKTVIPIAGALVLLQGIAEIIRCVLCLRTGQWPRRAHDVEEVDVEEIKKTLRVEEPEALETLAKVEGDVRKIRLAQEKEAAQTSKERQS